MRVWKIGCTSSLKYLLTDSTCQLAIFQRMLTENRHYKTAHFMQSVNYLIQRMTEIDLMEQNLAKLINEHNSLPELCDAEPADPFQKATFGRKMRKSKAESSKITSHSLQHNCSPYRSGSTITNPSRSTKLPEEGPLFKDPHQQEVENLFSLLKSQVDQLQSAYKSKLRRLRESEEDFSQEIEEIVGFLEGSVEFIIRDCLREPELAKPLPKPVSGKEDRKSKERVENNNNKENIVWNGKGREIVVSKRVQGRSEHNSKEGKGKGRLEKSIYESVLEERERRGKKRMI